MNRDVFLEKLSALLFDLPESERREAMQYYEDYFDDAGAENEADVLAALGTPEELAASIREGLLDEEGKMGEFSERGFTQTENQEENELSVRSELAKRESSAQARKEEGGASSTDLNKRYRSGGQKKNMGITVLLVILGILALPVLIPALLAAVILLFVFVVLAVILAVLAVLMLGTCLIAGVLAGTVGVLNLASYPAGALLAIGLGLMGIGMGILLALFFCWLWPVIVQGIGRLFFALFHKKGGMGK